MLTPPLPTRTKRSLQDPNYDSDVDGEIDETETAHKKRKTHSTTIPPAPIRNQQQQQQQQQETKENDSSTTITTPMEIDHHTSLVLPPTTTAFEIPTLEEFDALATPHDRATYRPDPHIFEQKTGCKSLLREWKDGFKPTVWDPKLNLVWRSRSFHTLNPPYRDHIDDLCAGHWPKHLKTTPAYVIYPVDGAIHLDDSRMMMSLGDRTNRRISLARVTLRRFADDIGYQLPKDAIKDHYEVSHTYGGLGDATKMNVNPYQLQHERHQHNVNRMGCVDRYQTHRDRQKAIELEELKNDPDKPLSAHENLHRQAVEATQEHCHLYHDPPDCQFVQSDEQIEYRIELSKHVKELPVDQSSLKQRSSDEALAKNQQLVNEIDWKVAADGMVKEKRGKMATVYACHKLGFKAEDDISECPYRTHHKPSFKSHYLAHRVGRGNAQQFKCTKCPSSFPLQSNLARHMKICNGQLRHHGTKRGPKKSKK